MPYTYLGTPYTTHQGQGGGEFTVLGQGGIVFRGEYSSLRGGYINACTTVVGSWIHMLNKLKSRSLAKHQFYADALMPV